MPTKLSVIIHGPAGCGKTRNKDKLKALYGLKHVVDGWTPDQAFNERDTLYLTNVTPADNDPLIRHYISFKSAANRIRREASALRSSQ